jgi:hypothetical protein
MQKLFTLITVCKLLFLNLHLPLLVRRCALARNMWPVNSTEPIVGQGKAVSCCPRPAADRIVRLPCTITDVCSLWPCVYRVSMSQTHFRESELRVMCFRNRGRMHTLIGSYAVLPTNDYIRFELTRPATPNTYVAVGMSSDMAMVRQDFCRACKNAYMHIGWRRGDGMQQCQRSNW